MTAAAPLPDDVERDAEQLLLIAQTLWFMVPPARTMFAPQLYDRGCRIYPELSTKRLVKMGDKREGNWAPTRFESKSNAQQAFDPANDLKRIERVALLATILTMVLPASVPAAPIAPELDALGMRCRIDLATEDMSAMGNFNMLSTLRRMGQQVPHLAALADKIQEAWTAAENGDRTIGERLVAEHKAQLAADQDVIRDTDVTAEDLDK